MDKKTYIFLAICMVIAISSIAGVKVNGKESRISNITSEYYQGIENAYVKQVRATLDSNGFRNAGITLTKNANSEGGFDYTLQVHHRRIDNMDEFQREELSDIIIGDGIELANSNVVVKYYILKK